MPSAPPTRPPTADSERYLLYLEAFGATKSGARLCMELDLNRTSPVRWRKEVIGFREKEREIRVRQERMTKDGKALPVSPAAADAMATFDATGLTKLQVLYLRNLYQLRHRVHAAQAAQIKWREVQVWLGSSDRFREEMKAWEDERLVALEDVAGTKGEKGDITAARMVLAANDPRYRNKLQVTGKVDHAHSVVNAQNAKELQGSWLQQFKPAAPAALPENTDVVDTEVVSAG